MEMLSVRRVARPENLLRMLGRLKTACLKDRFRQAILSVVVARIGKRPVSVPIKSKVQMMNRKWYRISMSDCLIADQPFYL
jgi:hypothetical protein